MRLEIDGLVDAAFDAAMIFAAAVEQHTPARAADECSAVSWLGDCYYI